MSYYSSSFLAAVTSCAPEATCPDDAGVSTSAQACFDAKLAPSVAQQKYAQDYCSACAASYGQTIDDCARGYFTLADGGSNEGSFLIDYNDSVATTLDTACVLPLGADAGVVACSNTLFDCINAELSKLLPPMCTSSGDGG